MVTVSVDTILYSYRFYIFFIILLQINYLFLDYYNNELILYVPFADNDCEKYCIDDINYIIERNDDNIIYISSLAFLTILFMIIDKKINVQYEKFVFDSILYLGYYGTFFHHISCIMDFDKEKNNNKIQFFQILVYVGNAIFLAFSLLGLVLLITFTIDYCHKIYKKYIANIQINLNTDIIKYNDV